MHGERAEGVEDGLPTVYNLAEMQAFYSKKPFVVAKRFIEVRLLMPTANVSIAACVLVCK